MSISRNRAVVALTAAGLLWGTTVPLTKVSLDVLGPAWLGAVRFAVAGLVLVVLFRPDLRGALGRGPVLWGALGYGSVILVQNAGLLRTSVTHAALLIGAMPVIVAVVVVVFHRTRVGGAAWAGFAVSSAGIAVVAGTGGHGSSMLGDGLVLASVLMSAAFTVNQPGVLKGRDPVAVTAVQFLSAAVVLTPVAALLEGSPVPAAMPSGSALLALAALATIGTVAPFTLFALGQTGVDPHVAGAFLNLETVVGTVIGAALMGEVFGLPQATGAMAILVGIALASRPARVAPRLRPTRAYPGAASPVHARALASYPR